MTQLYLHIYNNRNPKLVTISDDKLSLREIVREQMLSTPGGADFEDDCFILLEDESDEIHLDKKCDELKFKNRCHIHVHKCRIINVQIVYNGVEKTISAVPSWTIKKVKNEALKDFDITHDDGMDLILRIGSSEGEIVQSDEHVGSLTSKNDCSVKLYLTPKKNVQG